MSTQRKTPSAKGDYSSPSPINGAPPSDTMSTASTAIDPTSPTPNSLGQSTLSTASSNGNASTTSSNTPSGAASTTNSADPSSDSRRRQAYRDEAIRRKINTSLSKRGTNDSHRSRQNRRPPPGTVLSLRPSPPLTMKLTSTVFEAARLMAAKRENCVLVVDEDDTVCGIFTAKDLAFRVVGSGLDPKDVFIEQIMTRNPMCARTDTSATEALSLMVNEGFRHLPIMDENQDIAGVLDITKCFHEAMEKLERAYKSSRKLYDALEGAQMENGAQNEFGNSQKASQIINYVEALKRQMEGPDLTTVLDNTTMPVFVNTKTNAAQAAQLMRKENTTAVLVTDNNHITGIVTSKDIVLRVIAAGFNPAICSLVRVMTPQPDFAPQNMTIQNALRQMYEGNYLNLPVMGKNNEIVGIVDVLTLTYATLEQINSITTSDSEGPAWNKFWMSFDTDHESEHSGYASNSNYGRSATPGGVSGSGVHEATSPDISASELAMFNIEGFEVGPNDSVSHTGGEEDVRSNSQYQANNSIMGGSYAGDDLSQSNPFTFKFKSPTNRFHRITVTPNDGLEYLRKEIILKLKPEELTTIGGDYEFDEDGLLVSHGFGISYVDDEGDIISITSDKDLADAISIYREIGKQRAELLVHHFDQQLNIPAAASVVTATRDNVSGVSTPASNNNGLIRRGGNPFNNNNNNNNDNDKRRKNKDSNDDLVPGIPNELLLPGALVALAASIVLVFAFNRSHR